MKVCASLMSCDLLNIESEIRIIESAGVDGLHIDVMDGKFVPNITFGIEFIKRIAECSKLPTNVHLMIENPENFIDIIAYCKVNMIIIHVEGNRNIEGMIQKIHGFGIKVGIAINPQTSIEQFSYIYGLVDVVVIMGVHPGFGGQTLISSTLDKIEPLKKILKNTDIKIAMDGGLNEENSKIAIKKGVDILIMGSYLFDNNAVDKVFDMKNKINKICQIV